MKMLLSSVVFLLFASCTPKVYLIDRQTVLEQEASANWPELDKVFYAESLRSGPTPLQKAKDAEAEKLLSMTKSDSKPKAAAGKEKVE